ncbi:hypothetical protein JTB14_018398 [Gonioctena quinquepunctata]|nr:hypothetical protein JTB14_018398 [Gonioctena quinquepunctata]
MEEDIKNEARKLTNKAILKRHDSYVINRVDDLPYTAFAEGDTEVIYRHYYEKLKRNHRSKREEMTAKIRLLDSPTRNRKFTMVENKRSQIPKKANASPENPKDLLFWLKSYHDTIYLPSPFKPFISFRYEMRRFKLSKDAFLGAEAKSKNADWEIYYYLGQSLLKLGDISGAKEYAHKAVQLGKHEFCYALLIKILISQGDFKSAVAVSNAAVESCPDSVNMLTESGLLYLKVGPTQHAFERLSSALALEPTYPKALLGIGCIIQSGEIIANQAVSSWDIPIGRSRVKLRISLPAAALNNYYDRVSSYTFGGDDKDQISVHVDASSFNRRRISENPKELSFSRPSVVEHM